MDELLTTAQAAELLGVTARRVRWLAMTGKLPFVGGGRDYLIPRAAVLARKKKRPKPGRPKKGGK